MLRSNGDTFAATRERYAGYALGADQIAIKIDFGRGAVIGSSDVIPLVSREDDSGIDLTGGAGSVAEEEI